MNDLAAVTALLNAGLGTSKTGGLCQPTVTALGHFGARSAMLYSLAKSGRLTLVENFGFSRKVVTAYQSVNIFDDLPLGNAVLNSKIIRTTQADLEQQLEGIRELELPFDCYLHVPCRSLSSPVGAFVLGLIEEPQTPTKSLSDITLRALESIGAARLNQYRESHARAQADT
jgi:hypothetical protein